MGFNGLSGRDSGLSSGAGRAGYCRSCGSRLKKDVRICGFCGADRSENDPERLANARLDDAELSAKLSALSKEMTIFTLSAVGAVALAVLFALVNFFPPVIIFAAAAVVMVVLCIGRSGKIKKLVSLNIVKGALNEIIELEEYTPDGHIKSRAIKDADLIDNWDEISGSDYTRGKYRGAKVVFSDVKLVKVERHTDSKGNTHETRTTVFNGQWVICSLGRQLPYALRLRENREKIFGKGYRKSRSSIETENIAFNTQFQIIADDDHTAFYILTPHFMEYIMSADRKAGGRTFFCFDGDSVHIALGTDRDLFEVKPRSQDITNIAALRGKMRDEVKFITDIIDELMLNKYLFGKEE